MGKEVGLTNADVEATQTGQAKDAFDTALMRAVDELDETTNISDQTWAALGERQRMDLVFTTGNYVALAMALNTFGVELEETQER